jgi:hypothetical protein
MRASSVWLCADAILEAMGSCPWLGVQGSEMRMFSNVAAALCLSLVAAAAGYTAAPLAEAADAPAGASATAKPSAMTPSATAASDAAAKKHAKRTACLKDAKSKKLVGADKTSFLKNCIAAP